MFYQKASLLLITASSLIIIIQNRKKLSLEIIFLLTIFIGGFAFHILWEAKVTLYNSIYSNINANNSSRN